MTRSAVTIWFCLSVAAISAAIADPLVEWASNAGLFGPGNFTDHSSAGVVPALLVGACFLTAHLILRIRRALTGSPTPDLLRASRDALRGRIVRLLPAILATQLLMLYGMETCEQLAVTGHPLGGTIWLGGPVWISLAIQALACAVVAYAFSKAMRAFTRSAVRAVRVMLALAARSVRGVPPIELDRPRPTFSSVTFFVLCNVGERAPPLLTA